MIPDNFALKENLAALEEALINSSPTMPTLLREIHKHLEKDPSIVTILSPAECAVIVRGLSVQTKTTIATLSRTKATKKAIKNITLDDL